MWPRFWPTLYTVDECVAWTRRATADRRRSNDVDFFSASLFSSHPDSLINGRLEAQIDSNNSFPLYRSDD